MRFAAAMLVRGLLVAALFAATASAAPARSTKLSAAEQAWVKPLLDVWNVQNAGLHLVIGQASKPNALIVGSIPDNKNLTKTLLALVNCKEPKDLITKAGTPPPRLVTFRDALNSACIHDKNGAHDFAKAVGAVTKNDNKLVNSYLTQGVREFKLGSAQITKAYSSLKALGGASLFTA